MVLDHLEELFRLRYYMWFLNMDTEGIGTRAKTTKQTETVIHKCGHNKPSRPKHKQGTACHPTLGQRVSPSLMRSFLPPSQSRRLPPTPTTFNERETPGTVEQVRVGGTPPLQSPLTRTEPQWEQTATGFCQEPSTHKFKCQCPGMRPQNKRKKKNFSSFLPVV